MRSFVTLQSNKVYAFKQWIVLVDPFDRLRALMTLPEATAGEAMPALAFPAPGDPAMVAGESDAAGLAYCLRWSPRPNRRAP